MLMTIVFLLFACHNLTPIEQYKNDAIIEYELVKADIGFDILNFKGPILKERIENFDIDTNKVVFGWYYIHTKDTFWIYSEVDKLVKNKPTVHFSLNFNFLRLNWKEWIKEDINK